MALTLKFCHSTTSDCKAILFKDTTGAYNAISNTTGYGYPNPELTEFNTPGKVEIIITKPDNTKVTYPVTDDFPTINEELIYQITASSLGYSDKIIDGMYTIQYKLTDGNDAVVKTSMTFFYSCELNCKINRILADSVKFQMNCENCNNGINENIQKLGMITTLYKGLCSMSSCGTNITKINEALSNLQTLVSEYDTEDCGCN
jgi:hypothetical protein